MKRHFYTISEANALLPVVKLELERLQAIKGEFGEKYEQLHKLKAYHTQYGVVPEDEDPYFTLECEMDFLQVEANTILQSFERKDVQLKDLDTGLVDFPAMLGGEEVLLCWRQGEERVEHYHGLYDGFAGRKRLAEE